MEGGRTNERPGTDHVISGPMRGLGKNCTRWRRQTDTQTQGHGDSMTNSAQWGRVGEKMGGVVTLVKNNLKAHTIKVKEGEEKDEFLITHLDHTNPPIKIVNIYGGIEERMDNQDLLETWGRIKVDLDNIKDRQESCVLIGDFNRAIGAGKLGIKENKPKVSYSGKLVLELLETGEYVLGNSTDKVEGGPWTWVSRADHRVRSCIDLVIMSADLGPYLKRIVIDVEHNFAPARLRMVAGRKRLVYSDHYPIVVEFEKLPKGWIANETASSWNMNTPGGWEEYERLTEAASVKINEIVENYDLSVKEMSDLIEKN